MAREPRRDPSGRRIDGAPVLVWVGMAAGMLIAASLVVYFGAVLILGILRSGSPQ
jgi:hypothetical protein